jgi:hypothetical protein
VGRGELGWLVAVAESPGAPRGGVTGGCEMRKQSSFLGFLLFKTLQPGAGFSKGNAASSVLACTRPHFRVLPQALYPDVQNQEAPLAPNSGLGFRWDHWQRGMWSPRLSVQHYQLVGQLGTLPMYPAAHARSGSLSGRNYTSKIYLDVKVCQEA